ncbi:MAG TPA: tetratricopeptide repeat protein, partial [Thermoanaerobaculia bacterium]|nr:tetratricopeptide repeat protein [Thermoanaerobaculia bacterium]
MLLLVLVLAAPPSLQSLLARVEQAIARKDFAAAEVVARQAVEAHPESRDARSTLAWVTLWNGHYREARALFRALPDDAATRLGLAQAEYWDGDLRAAQRGFAAVLELDPKNADARRALDEIRESSRPGFAIDVDALSDDQPYRSTAPRAIVYGFTDPLTKWIATAMIARFHRGGDAASIGGGIDTTHNRTTLRANASLFRFPDGARELLPRVEVLHPFGTTTLALLGERRELLRAASALRTHASVQTLSLRWSREHENKPAFAVRAEKLRYFDD